MSISESFYGSGGRKRANARVFLIPTKVGVGKFTVNKQAIQDYFSGLAADNTIYQPINLLNIKDLLSRYDVKVTVKGGGKSGQRDAICLGLAKALVMLEEKQRLAENTLQNTEETLLSWRYQLRKKGLLTRDSRKVERKRYGLHKARKRAPLVKR